MNVIVRRHGMRVVFMCAGRVHALVGRHAVPQAGCGHALQGHGECHEPYQQGTDDPMHGGDFSRNSLWL